jgi:hypothetical protein
MECTLDKRTIIGLHVYTFNSVNDFRTVRFTYKALPILEQFKRIFYSVQTVFSVLPEKYVRVFASDKRLILELSYTGQRG